MGYKYDVIWDASHGGKDNGGGCCEYWTEKEMGLDMSLYCNKRSKELGLKSTITRDKDIYLSPNKRTSIVKNSGAKICISNHINKFNSKAKGAETIHSIWTNAKLATMILDEIVKTGMSRRRVFSKKNTWGKDWYYMHRNTGKVETIIVEYGFADYKPDADFINKNWKKMCEATLKALCIYLGRKYRAPKKDVKNIDYKELYEEQLEENSELVTENTKLHKDNAKLEAELLDFESEVSKLDSKLKRVKKEMSKIIEEC